MRPEAIVGNSMMTDSHPTRSSSWDSIPSDLPKLSEPAQRALARAGFTRLTQFVEVAESDVSRLHSVGPLAIGRLRDALAGARLSRAGV
jgi:hypothetical protein